MADEKAENNKEEQPSDKAEDKQTSQTLPSDTTKDGEGETKSWWTEAQKRGFKEEKDVWTSYGEAEKKISSQGEQIKTAEKFEQEVAPILNVLWSDPELLEQVKKKLSPDAAQTQPQVDKKAESKEQPVAATDPETRSVLEGQIVGTFEANKGIDKLDDESRKEVRKIIGGYMGKWIKPGEQVPLPKLDSFLEDAFDLALRRDKKLKSILESAPQSSNTEGAILSSQPSGGGKIEGEVTLTPAQAKVAVKMPGGIEAYKKGLKKVQSKS